MTAPNGDSDRCARAGSYTRRSIVSALGTGAALTIGSGVAAGGGYTETEGLRIESWDGTEIAADLYEPAGAAPRPAVIMPHGWSSHRNADVVHRTAVKYARRGYVVLAIDARGHGDSEGESTVNGPNEVRDVSALIDWLAAHDAVENDGPDDPRVGMDGISYGGSIQPLAAAHDDRLDAIVPRSFWVNLFYSHYPNGVHNIPNGALIRALGPAATRSVLTGSTPPRPDSVRYGVDPDFYRLYAEALATGEASPRGKTYLLQRSAILDVDRIDAPALCIGAWADTLLPSQQVGWFHDALRERGVPTAMIMFQGGHASPGEQRAFCDRAALQWMDEHLKGEGSYDLPPVVLRDAQAGEWRPAGDYPPPESRPVVGSFADVADGDSTTLGNPVAPAPETPVNAVEFDFPVRSPLEFVGTPSVTLHLEPLGAQAFAFVKVSHVAADGATTHLNSHVTPFRVDVAAGSSTVAAAGGDLGPFQRRLEPGDALRVTVSTTDPNFQGSRESAGVRLHHAADRPSGITLPTVGDPAGPALGVPPVTGSREDDGSVFTAGQTNHVALSVDAERPVHVRDRIPASWTVAGGDAATTRVEGDVRLVEFRQPVENGTREYFAEAPDDAGSPATTFGPAEYRDGDDWRPVPGTTDTNAVAPVDTDP